MKRMMIKIVPVALITLGLLLPSLGCSSGASQAEAASQAATVRRGNLSVDITASGNLKLSRTQDLAFEVAGTVEEVLVEAGDAVEEGQMLAKLDTTEWDDQVKTLDRSLITARRKLTTAERGVATAERKVTDLQRQVSDRESAVTAAERQVISKELSVRQAEINLQSAQDNLKQIADVKKIQDRIDNAEYSLKFAKSMLTGDLGGGLQLSDYSYWSGLVTLATDQLAQAKQDLADLLDGTNTQVASDVALQVAQKQLQMQQGQMSLEDARKAVEDARQDVLDARQDVADARQAVLEAQQDTGYAGQDLENAQQDVADAQKALDDARSASPLITAPFTGFVTKVNVEGGDEIKKGTVAVIVADPDKFEADILVSEMDIMQIKVGGDATVQADAIPGVSLPARVTRISPTATIQSGVVNYAVKVELQPLSSVTGGQPGANQEQAGAAAGQFQQRMQQAVESGQLTQEQLDAMQQRILGFSSRQSSGAGGAFSGAAAAAGDYQLREGLTVSVSIVTAQANDALLVPNGAITRRGGQSYVNVQQADGSTAERAVTTGISNWQYTQVTDGLSEGDTVLVPQTASTGSSSTSTQPGGMPPGGFVPGLGRITR